MTIDVEITARESVPSWFAYGAPLATVIVALLIASIPLLWIDVNPVLAYYEIFVVTPTTLSGIANSVVTILPLFLTGLAVYIPFRAGLWNIGAEGQLYVGAVVGTGVGLNLDQPGFIVIPVMVLAASISAAAYGIIPGYLKARHDVNEIITSLMLTFIATTLTGYLLRGPLQGDGGISATDRLPDVAQLPTVFHPRLHVGVGVLVIVCALAYLLINGTRLGYEISFIGSNAGAAKQSGISETKIYVIVFMIGGALAGLAGSIEIAGVQGRLIEGFSPDYGFTAVAVALLGRNGVLRVLLAATFFGVLTTGGNLLAITQNVPTALVHVIVAFVILFLLTAEFFKRNRITVRVGDDATPVSGGIE